MISANQINTVFRKFIDGDVSAFYTYLYRDMLMYASSVLPGQMSLLAEDCVQHAVEKAYRERERFESAVQWKVFILTCIRNQCISYYRSNMAAERYNEFVRNLDELQGDMLLDYIRTEVLHNLYEAIDSLPEDMRLLLELSFEQGLKNAEIAERLGVAEITVKKRKARLIAMLRSRMPDTPAVLLPFIIVVLETLILE